MSACALLLSGLGAREPRRTVLGSLAGGVCAATAPLFHPYAVPAVGVVLVAFLVAAWRRPDRVRLIVGMVVGCLVPTALYLSYVVNHWEAFNNLVGSAAGFFKEPDTASLNIIESLREEIARRWTRAYLLEPFRLLLILAGLSVIWRRSRAVAALCLTWIAVYFLILWLKVPKDTHYQIIQLALPTAMLIALAIDSVLKRDKGASKIAIPNRARWAPAMWLCSLTMGTALLSLFPIAAVMQWNARSHSDIVKEVALSVPRESIVAVDPSAYFASLANDCTTYYVEFKRRGAHLDPEGQARYQRDLFTDHGVEYLILDHETEPPNVAAVDGIALEPMGTIGQARAALPFAKDPEYHFDVYRVIRDEARAVDGER